jgi:hypothetical protein
MSQLPHRITCSVCGQYRPLIDFRRIDMTNPLLGVSLFRHSFVTAFQALMEVNLLRAWAFEYDHKRYCGKKAVCRVEQAELTMDERMLMADVGYWENKRND